MSFQGKYQILHILSDSEVRCFRARQIPSDRTVLLHQLWPERNPPNQPYLASLLTEFLRIAPAEISGHILEIGEDNNRGFVATEDLPECLDLRAWLQSATGVQTSPVESGLPPTYAEPAPVADGAAPVRAAVPRGKVDEPGDFTLFFQHTPAGVTPVTSSLNDDETAPPLPPSPVAPAAPRAGKTPPGDFTGMFLAAGNAPAQPSSPLTPVVPAAPRTGAPPPGDFTAMFLAAGNAPPQPSSPLTPAVPAAPHAGKTPPGDFTGMFLAGANAPAQLSSPLTPVVPAAPRAGAPPPGDFTGMFLAGSNAPAQPSSPVSPPRPAENRASAAKPRSTIVRGQPPSGFEVVFKSRKPRLTMVPPAEPSGALAAPITMVPPAEPLGAVAAPITMVPPAEPSGAVAAPTTEKSAPGVGEFTMMFARAGTGAVEPGVASAVPAPLGDGLPPGPSPDLRKGAPASLTTPEPVLPPPPPRSPAGSGEAGVLDRLFVNREGTEAPPYGPKVPVVGSEGPTVTSADAPRGPGEFTRLFSVQREDSTRPSSPGATPGSAGSQLPPFPPMAATPREIPLRESAGGSGKGKGSGSFTQFFQTGGEAGMPGAPAAPPSPPPTFAPGPSRSAQKEPGEVTRILQGYRPPKPDSAEQVLPAATPANAPSIQPDGRSGGEFPRAFHDPFPPGASVPPAAVAPPFVEPAPPPPKSAGPGEYTRIMASPRRSAAAPPPSGPPGATPGGARPPMPSMAAPPMPSMAAPPMPSMAAPPMPSMAAPPMPGAPPVSYPQVAAPQPPAYQMPPVPYKPPPPPAFPPAPAPGIAYPQPKAPPPPALPKASPPAGSEKRVLLVSLVILGCLLILTVAVVVYFAIRH